MKVIILLTFIYSLNLCAKDISEKQRFSFVCGKGHLSFSHRFLNDVNDFEDEVLVKHKRNPRRSDEFLSGFLYAFQT